MDQRNLLQLKEKPSREEEAHRWERISPTNTSGRGLISPKYKKKITKKSKSPKQTNNPLQTNPFRRDGTDLIEFSKEVRKVAESQFVGPSKAKSKSTMWPRSTLLSICPKGSTSYSVDTCQAMFIVVNSVLLIFFIWYILS